MKKKLLFSLLILLSVFTLVGCGESDNKENKEDSKDEKGKTEVKVDDIKVEFDMSNSFNEMKYKYPSSALSSNLGTYTIMDYMNGQEFVFRIAMAIFRGKTIGEAIEGSTLNSIDAIPYNNNTWNVYEGVQEDGKKVINYVTEYNGDAYTITFISDKDLHDLADNFMKNVVFN